MSDSIREWSGQYLGEFATLAVPVEDRAAIMYHLKCEAFDRTVCSGVDVFGDAQPISSYELSIINRNALEVRRQIQAALPEMRPGQFGQAIRRWSTRSFNELQQFAARIVEDDAMIKQNRVDAAGQRS